MIYFIGAGPGDPELLTVKGRDILRLADLVLYPGSLLNPAILAEARREAELIDTSGLTLEEIVALMSMADREGKTVARLHSGDPSIYGAVAEQMSRLVAAGVPLEVVPGVSSMAAAAAALGVEYTVPGGSQTVILTRLGARTPVPEAQDLARLAVTGSSLVIFLSAHLIDRVVERLGSVLPLETPAAVVEKASWPQQRVLRGTLADIGLLAGEAGIKGTALILVGDFLNYGRDATPDDKRSRLYDGGFSHGFRKRRSGNK